MSFKWWANNEVLTAADVNAHLMSQTASRHASAAARSAAVASPSEGQLTYLSDVHKLQIFDGTSWVDLWTRP